MEVIETITPPPEPDPPRTTLNPEYRLPPDELLDSSDRTGRPNEWLRAAARHRDGNANLYLAALMAYHNYLERDAPPYSHTFVTAITQLAATGSNAHAAWTADPKGVPYLTTLLIDLGMPPSEAGPAAQAIMADFDFARTWVRHPLAGGPEASSKRNALPHNGWIAVCGEEDPPDFPVNVAITPHPQFHVRLNVEAIPLNVRYIVASNTSIAIPEGAASNPSLTIPRIPPDDEVILYIHGEGSRAEEALDFMQALLDTTAARGGRSFTVLSFDQPGCGYTTSVVGGTHETVEHERVAELPPVSPGAWGYGFDTGPGMGSSLLDFVHKTILEFVGTVVTSQGKTLTAVVGGSLGGHMALRLAASGAEWLKHVIAWSPASVWDHTFPLELLTQTVDIKNSSVSDSMATYRAHESEHEGSRSDFFQTVFYKDTVNLTLDGAGLLAMSLVAASAVPLLLPFAGALFVADVAGALMKLPTIPPQPQMWYREEWGPPATSQPLSLPCPPPPNANSYGQTKLVHVCEAQLDRREVYNKNLRQWHWRIGGECIGFEFDALMAEIQKPLLLMVGANDDYPLVNFAANVMRFGAELPDEAEPSRTQEIENTGHSIHNERPHFLAGQVIAFTFPLRRLVVSVKPSVVHMNRPTDLTVSALDSMTGQPVPGSEVIITNYTAPKPPNGGGMRKVLRGSPGVPFKGITFHYGREYDGETRRTTYDIEPEIVVSAPNYMAQVAPVTFLSH